MKNPKNGVGRAHRLVAGSIVFALCALIFYRLVLEYNGPVAWKIAFFVLAAVLIGIISSDFHEDIARWFRENFGKDE